MFPSRRRNIASLSLGQCRYSNDPRLCQYVHRVVSFNLRTFLHFCCLVASDCTAHVNTRAIGEQINRPWQHNESELKRAGSVSIPARKNDTRGETENFKVEVKR